MSMITRFAGAIATALTASLGLASSALAAPKVAVDIAPVHALVARVMEGVGEPALIIPPEATPHAYSLRPSEASALERADMVVWIGAELTPWLEGSIDTLAGDAHVIPLLGAGGSSMREFREGLAFAAAEPENEDHGEGHEHDAHGHDDHGHDDHGHDDHAHDDHGHEEHEHEEHGHEEHAQKEHGHDAHTGHAHDHGHAHDGADPHAWLDPANARAWLEVIATELAEHDPENAARYEANAAAAAEELAVLEDSIAAQLEPVQGVPYVVYHDAYQYFEARFGVSPTGALSLGDAADPGPARIAALRDLARDKGIVCVFGEPQFGGERIASIFGDTVGHGVLDPLGSSHTPGPDLYDAVLTDMADALAGCLSAES